MTLRRAGSCAACGAHLNAGAVGVWFPDERVVRCLGCTEVELGSEDGVAPGSSQAPDRVVADAVAGGSAQREYDRRSERELARKQARIDDDAEWRKAIVEERPILGRIAAAVTPRPQIGPESHATKAWKVGAEGERRVAEVLADLDGVEVLHDRRIPRTRANIDHLVVGPSGVFVVDAKKYTGAVEVRERGTLFRSDLRLYVNGRDRSPLVDGVVRQTDIVKSVLASSFPLVPVRGVLCFIGCEWGFFMKPKHVRGVTALWPLKLPEHVSAVGPHGADLAEVAEQLRRALPPAS